MHDLYSITVLINVYRCILINFDNFLEKEVNNVSSDKAYISFLLFQRLVMAMQQN